MGQEASSGLIVKSFVSLGFIVTIDNIFAAKCLPKAAFDNAKEVNDHGLLTLGEDPNAAGKLWSRTKRLWRDEEMPLGVKVGGYFDLFLSVLVNTWYHTLKNLHVVWFNYFGALCVLCIQYYGVCSREGSWEGKHLKGAKF